MGSNPASTPWPGAQQPQRLTVGLVSSTAALGSVCPRLLSPMAVTLLLCADDTRGRCHAQPLRWESYFLIGVLTQTRPSGARGREFPAVCSQRPGDGPKCSAGASKAAVPRNGEQAPPAGASAWTRRSTPDSSGIHSFTPSLIRGKTLSGKNFFIVDDLSPPVSEFLFSCWELVLCAHLARSSIRGPLWGAGGFSYLCSYLTRSRTHRHCVWLSDACTAAPATGQLRF